MENPSSLDWLFASFAAMIVGAFATVSFGSAFGWPGVVVGGILSMGMFLFAFHKALTEK